MGEDTARCLYRKCDAEGPHTHVAPVLRRVELALLHALVLLGEPESDEGLKRLTGRRSVLASLARLQDLGLVALHVTGWKAAGPMSLWRVERQGGGASAEDWRGILQGPHEPTLRACWRQTRAQLRQGGARLVEVPPGAAPIIHEGVWAPRLRTRW